MKSIKFRPWPFFGLVYMYYDKGGWWQDSRDGSNSRITMLSLDMHTTKKNPLFRSISLIVFRIRCSYCYLKQEKKTRLAGKILLSWPFTKNITK